jgi:hypothetical protein
MRPSAPSKGQISLPGTKFKSANYAAAPCTRDLVAIIKKSLNKIFSGKPLEEGPVEHYSAVR